LTIKAAFLDFYGTVVHEDDEIIPVICDRIQKTAAVECTIPDIGKYWWVSFSRMFHDSYGNTFETQRTLGLKSLGETIRYFNSTGNAEEIIETQFNHWQKPKIFDDSITFLNELDLPVYILSNIDTKDVEEAIRYHDIQVDGIITSEDVRSYKPRPEMFNEALKRYNLKNTEVIHIGDSLTSDVQGAQNVGIPGVWLNRKNKLKPDGINPDFICKNLFDVSKILK
jgi:2-haloalkanoic acid dehalogenase type II